MIRYLLILLLPISIILHLLTGSFDLTLGEIFTALSGAPTPHSNILFQIRLPRMLMAIESGSILSLGGLYMQTLVRNPLADPYIMGITSGAGLGVNLLFCGVLPFISINLFTVPIFAWIGALASILLVVALGFKTLYQNSERMLMAGVATSSICTAFSGLLIYRFSDSDQMRKIIFWTFGNLEKATWDGVYIGTGMLIIAIVFGLLFARKMDLLLTGEIAAHTLGMNVRQTKLVILLVTSLIVGGVTAFSGPIGFVGMMIPHFSRSLNGGLHFRNVIYSALIGGTYLCLCDSLCRLVLPPAGLPIGIVTALLGVPFFLYLIGRK